jgi:hypothetical protein
VRNPIFSLFRILYLIIIRTIDPFSFRLFAIHRIIARILHLSVAGSYINRILEELDKKDIKTDKFIELRYLVELKLGG